jgi:CelD/BcsL family acetyltransferase involved in cellulose biosynthesis
LELLVNSILEMIMLNDTKLTLELLTTFEQFCALKSEWNALAANQVKTIFMTHLWLEEWWRVFGAEYQIWTLLARENGILIGILPLMLAKEKLGVRKLRFMGAGEVTPNHLDIIAAPQKRDRVIQAFISYFSQNTSDWDVLELDKIPQDSPSMEALKDGLRSQGLLIKTAVSATCPYADLPGSFDEYLRSRSPKTQEGFRYAKRRIAKDFPGMYLGIAASTEEVEKVMATLMQLHQNRWLQKGYSGAFASKRTINFHYAVARKALESNHLRLYYLQINNEIIAVIYCYRVEDCVQYYLGGFDERWAKYSPGNIINMFALEQSILTGARRFDFLEGEENYKQHWMTHNYENFIVMAFRPNLRGRMYKFQLELKNALVYLGIHLVPQKIRRPIWQLYMKRKLKKQEYPEKTDTTH